MERNPEKSCHVLSKLMISCWAAFIVILGQLSGETAGLGFYSKRESSIKGLGLILQPFQGDSGIPSLGDSWRKEAGQSLWRQWKENSGDGTASAGEEIERNISIRSSSQDEVR